MRVPLEAAAMSHYSAAVSLKSVKVSLHPLNSKKNGPVLLCKTIFRHGNCFMLSFATDDKDGYVLKLEDEICLIYSSLRNSYRSIL